jgi:pimeloyl-ACP methyl ester carboxylesterase
MIIASGHNLRKPEVGYSIQSLAKDAISLIEALNLDAYIILGHSMGGKVAQYIAAQKPVGLRKLILVGPRLAVDGAKLAVDGGSL